MLDRQRHKARRWLPTTIDIFRRRLANWRLRPKIRRNLEWNLRAIHILGGDMHYQRTSKINRLRWIARFPHCCHYCFHLPRLVFGGHKRLEREGYAMSAEPQPNPTVMPQDVRGRRVRLDRRTKIAQRATRLRATYFAILEQAGRDMGSVELITALDRAAELQAIAESLRAAALRGRAVFDDLVRLERVSAQALRALRLPSAADKQGPSLSDYLQQQAAP
jgi:hypothetical protein